MQLGVFNAQEKLTNFWRNFRVGKLWGSFKENNLTTYKEDYA